MPLLAARRIIHPPGGIIVWTGWTCIPAIPRASRIVLRVLAHATSVWGEGTEFKRGGRHEDSSSPFPRPGRTGRLVVAAPIQQGGGMTREIRPTGDTLREFSQLLRIQQRLLGMLEEVLDELGAPTTLSLLRELRNRTGTTAAESFARINASVEGGIRELQVFESEIQKEILADPGQISVEGVTNLPAPLVRFLAERSQNPRFSYEVRQDAVRGWIISWKEYAAEGIVRGFGQFYERPYAWLDD